MQANIEYGTLVFRYRNAASLELLICPEQKKHLKVLVSEAVLRGVSICFPMLQSLSALDGRLVFF